MTSPIDTYLELVANEYRRETLQLLRGDDDDEITLDALLDHLSRDGGPNTGQSEDRKQLALRLQHIHLPKLAANDVIEYNPEGGHIRYRPDSSLETVLESFPPEQVTVTS